MTRPLCPAPPASPQDGDLGRFLKLLFVGLAANGLLWGGILAARRTHVRTAGAMPAPRAPEIVEGPASAGDANPTR